MPRLGMGAQRGVVAHQILDEHRQKLRAARDTGLAVDRVGLRLDRAFRGLAQARNLGRGHALDGKQRHVPFGRGQAPFGEFLGQKVAKRARGAAQAFMRLVPFAQKLAHGQAAEHRAKDQPDRCADFHQLAQLPRQGAGFKADHRGEDVRGEDHREKRLDQENPGNDALSFHAAPVPESAFAIAPV